MYKQKDWNLCLACCQKKTNLSQLLHSTHTNSKYMTSVSSHTSTHFCYCLFTLPIRKGKQPMHPNPFSHPKKPCASYNPFRVARFAVDSDHISMTHTYRQIRSSCSADLSLLTLHIGCLGDGEKRTSCWLKTKRAGG